jgi:hypothetical protein
VVMGSIHHVPSMIYIRKAKNKTGKLIFSRYIMKWKFSDNKTKVTLGIVLIIITVGLFWSLLNSYDVSQEYDRSFHRPTPLPNWLIAVRPKPGEVVSVLPGYSVICPTIHYPDISIQPDIRSKITLILNGNAIIHSN